MKRVTDQLNLSRKKYKVIKRPLSLGEQIDNQRKHEIWEQMTEKQRAYLPRFEIRNGIKTPFTEYTSKWARKPSEHHPWKGKAQEDNTLVYGMPEEHVSQVLQDT